MNGSSSERILVCGADQQFQLLVSRALGPESTRVDYIEDPGQAIAKAMEQTGVLLVDSASIPGGLERFLERVSEAGDKKVPVVIRTDPATSARDHDRVEQTGVFFFLSREQFDAGLLDVVNLAGQLAIERRRSIDLHRELESSELMLGELIRIGRQLSGHKDLHALLEAILSVSRATTRADSGSIYMVEELGDSKSKSKFLRFMIPQNDSMPVELSNHTLGLDGNSIAGYVALTGKLLRLDDVYTLPQDGEYLFDRKWDERTGYRSQSMLVVPMKGHKDQILGIIQLINKKEAPEHRSASAGDTAVYVRPFSERDAELIEAIASQASIAVENARIVDDMMRLFDGFVSASARAVECMDSATSGHCERLAHYAVTIAEKINTITEGPLARYKFDRAQLKELRYAALMHDVGKIGVRESVLKKDRRLTDDRLEVIKMRFQYFKEVLKHKAFRQAMNNIFSGSGKSFNLSEVERTLEKQIKELDDCLAYVVGINSLARLDDPDYDKLKSISHSVLVDVDGAEHPYLNQDEFENLSVRRGNLTRKERLEIEEHVVLTYKILASIPWLPEYKLVPDIAGAHHERIDGSGYPNSMKGDEIPIGAQILAMLDIYEALTASDRPYKPAMSRERAIEILQAEVSQNHLNPDVVKLFVESGIYKSVDLPQPTQQRKEGSTKDAW